jgi:outer membrane biosynthesis protein TonB
VLAVHLVSAGGVATPPAPPIPSGAISASLAPQFVAAVEPVAAPPRPRDATSRAPLLAPPMPKAPIELPTRPLPQLRQPPSTGSAPRVYDEDEVDFPPRRLWGVSAPYPDWGPRLARGARVSITASFVVNEAGDVTDIRVEQGGGVLEVVLLEISRWKYEPGKNDGQPVKVRVSWKHSFIGG